MHPITVQHTAQRPIKQCNDRCNKNCMHEPADDNREHHVPCAAHTPAAFCMLVVAHHHTVIHGLDAMKPVRAQHHPPFILRRIRILHPRLFPVHQAAAHICVSTCFLSTDKLPHRASVKHTGSTGSDSAIQGSDSAYRQRFSFRLRHQDPRHVVGTAYWLHGLSYLKAQESAQQNKFACDD